MGRRKQSKSISFFKGTLIIIALFAISVFIGQANLLGMEDMGCEPELICYSAIGLITVLLIIIVLMLITMIIYIAIVIGESV